MRLSRWSSTGDGFFNSMGPAARNWYGGDMSAWVELGLAWLSLVVGDGTDWCALFWDGLWAGEGRYLNGGWGGLVRRPTLGEL